MRDRKSIPRKEKQSIGEINYTKQNLRNVSYRFIASLKRLLNFLGFSLPFIDLWAKITQLPSDL